MIEKLTQLDKVQLGLLRSSTVDVAFSDIGQYVQVYDLNDTTHKKDGYEGYDATAAEELSRSLEMMSFANAVHEYRKNKYGID